MWKIIEGFSLFPRYNKTENLRNGSPEMFAFSHLLLEARSKYSPNLKPYSRTHDLINVVEAFSHISFNYNSLLPIRIKTKPAIFTLRRKKAFANLFEAAFSQEEIKEESLISELGKDPDDKLTIEPLNKYEVDNVVHVNELDKVDEDEYLEHNVALKPEEGIEGELENHKSLIDKKVKSRKSGTVPKSKHTGKRPKSKVDPENKKSLTLSDDANADADANGDADANADLFFLEEELKLLEGEEESLTEDVYLNPAEESLSFDNLSSEESVEEVTEQQPTQYEINVKDKIKALIREEKEEEERLRKKLKPMKGKLEILLAEKKNAKIQKGLKENGCSDCNDDKKIEQFPSPQSLESQEDGENKFRKGSENENEYLKVVLIEKTDIEENNDSYETKNIEEDDDHIKVTDFSTQSSRDIKPLVAGVTPYVASTDQLSISDLKVTTQIPLMQTLLPVATIDQRLITAAMKEPEVIGQSILSVQQDDKGTTKFPNKAVSSKHFVPVETLGPTPTLAAVVETKSPLPPPAAALAPAVALAAAPAALFPTDTVQSVPNLLTPEKQLVNPLTEETKDFGTVPPGLGLQEQMVKVVQSVTFDLNRFSENNVAEDLPVSKEPHENTNVPSAVTNDDEKEKLSHVSLHVEDQEMPLSKMDTRE